MELWGKLLAEVIIAAGAPANVVPRVRPRGASRVRFSLVDRDEQQGVFAGHEAE